MRAILLTVIVALGLAVAPVGAAKEPARAAAPEKVESRITLKVIPPMRAQVSQARRGTTTAFGKVKSERGACTRGRGVTVYRRPEGGGPKSLVGETATDNEGKWSLEILAFPPGDYYAMTPEKEVGQGSAARICRADRSKPYKRRT